MEKLFSPPQGVEHEKPVFMRSSRKFLIFGSDSEPYSCLSGSWLRNGAIFRLWHQNWCRFLNWNFCVGIKIDAILITSSLIPSRLSHLASVIFKKIISSTYSQWEVTKLRVFFKNFFSHLTRASKPFYQPIRRKILLQSLTATFAAEKRHDFWKNIPTILYRNFQSRKTTHFPKLFQKSFLLLYRKFFRSNLNPYFKNFFSAIVTWTFAVLNGIQISKKHKNSACLVFRSRRYIFSSIQL